MTQQGDHIQKQNTFSLIYWALYLCVFVSMFLSLRAVSSVSIGLILITALYERQFSLRGLPKNRPVNQFLAAGVIYLLVQLAVCLVTTDPSLLERMQLQSGLVLIPLAVYLSSFINKKSSPPVFFSFSFLLALAGLYCLTRASIQYMHQEETGVFFYHSLVKWVSGHAVYFSIYVFFAILFLMESLKQRRMILPRPFYIILVIFLVAFLVLLSSRLIIVIFCIYLLYFVYSLFRNSKRRKRFGLALFLLAIANASLIMSTDNPVKKRFSDLEGSLDAATKEKNTPAEYLNGLQFRLLQWKLVPGILTEKDQWASGVGPSNAQHELNKKYAERNMYQGDGVKDPGYNAYNTHNQFLQALLQTGIPGLLAFVLLCCALLNLILKRATVMGLFITAAILAYCFVESLLETQYGILLFGIFPLMSFVALEKNDPGIRTGLHTNKSKGQHQKKSNPETASPD